MSCKRKTCKYFKKCWVKDANDGSGCGDYEYQKTPVLKRKKRYSDEDVYKAMGEARKHFTYNELMWAEIYMFRVPNKEVIEHIEVLMNNKKMTLF